MNKTLKLTVAPIILTCLMLSLGGGVSAAGSTVYFNDFGRGPASLNGLSIVDESLPPYSASVTVESGQLRLDASYDETYIVANAASFAAPYSSILRNNPGTVIWAFNVSNADAIYNNGFFFCPASDTSGGYGYYSSYTLLGGIYVGNRMEFYRSEWTGPSSNPLIAVPSEDGLGPLPSKGSFRITYEPSSDLWSLFGYIGPDYVDPTTVSTLLGSVVDASFTSVPLPYMSWGGVNMGSDFFDNISVSVVPEPPTTALGLLAVAISAASKLWQSRARSKARLWLSHL